jgi:L-threonylcarbamoyladenylate synthase
MKLLSLEEPRALEIAIAAVQRGGVVAIPTDTVYGLAASLKFPDALERIFAIKGRDRAKPLPVLLSSARKLDGVTEAIDARQGAFLARFWPGPLTAALPARAELPHGVVAADRTAGIRVPDHSVALVVVEHCGGALAVTSANKSGEPPACTAGEIEAQLGDTVDVILDGGLAPCGLPSTVVSFAGDTISIVREGAIPRSTVLTAWEAIVTTDTYADTATAAPR